MITSATANPVLQALFIQFTQSSDEFVAQELFPWFYAAMQSADYYIYGANNMLNVPRNVGRAPKGKYSRSDSVLSSANYSCKEFGHEEVVDDRERKKYSAFIDLDSAVIKRLARIELVNREFMAQTQAATLTGVNVSALWSDYTTSNPILDVDTGREAIHNATGMDPNVLVMPRSVFNVVKEHPVVRDHYKFVNGGSVTAQMIAALFRFDKVVVAGGIQNTANEGQTAVTAQIWGKDVYLAKVDTSQDLGAPGYGRTFAWTAETGPSGVLLESYRDDHVRGDVHRFRQDIQVNQQIAAAAYRLAAVI